MWCYILTVREATDRYIPPPYCSLAPLICETFLHEIYWVSTHHYTRSHSHCGSLLSLRGRSHLRWSLLRTTSRCGTRYLMTSSRNKPRISRVCSHPFIRYRSLTHGHSRHSAPKYFQLLSQTEHACPASGRGEMVRRWRARRSDLVGLRLARAPTFYCIGICPTID